MGTPDNKSDKEKIINLLRFCIRNWYCFAAGFIVCGIVGIIYLKTATNIWNVSAMVSFRQDESLAGSGAMSSLMNSFGFGASTENVEDETSKLSSQGNMKRVVKKYGLNTLYEETKLFGLLKTDLFEASPVYMVTNPATADTLSVIIRFQLKMNNGKANIKMIAGKNKIGTFDFVSLPATIESEWGKYTFDKSPYYEQYDDVSLSITYHSYDFMAQIYQRRVFIDYNRRTSMLILLNYECANINFAKKIITEVIDSHNSEHVKEKGLATDKTLQYIDNQLETRRNLLTDADSQIQNFKNKYNITGIEADVKYYLSLSGELQAQLLHAETQLSIANIILEFINDNNNQYTLIPFDLTLADANMVAAITAYNEQLVRRNDALKGGNTQSALIQSLNNQLDLKRENLSVSLNNIRKGLQITLDNIRKKDMEFNSKLRTMPAIEREYLTLAREQSFQQTVYTFLLQMREQSAVKGVSILPKLQIVNYPYAGNKRVAPRTLYTGVAVLFTGFILSLLLIFAKPAVKFLKETLQSPEETAAE